MLAPSISLLGLAQTAIGHVPTRPTVWTPPRHVFHVKMLNVWYVTSRSATGVKKASIFWVIVNVVYLWPHECVWDGKWPLWFVCSDGNCVEDCGEGFFMDQESRDCEPCHAACRACGGPRYDDCDSCREGSKLRDGECLQRRQFTLCPKKHFANSTSNAPPMSKSICFEDVSPNVSVQRTVLCF